MFKATSDPNRKLTLEVPHPWLQELQDALLDRVGHFRIFGSTFTSCASTRDWLVPIKTQNLIHYGHDDVEAWRDMSQSLSPRYPVLDLHCA
ncbi:hypothetical protein E4U53_003215 [Claviceps sorghi]|nr:hypothetical protein E4U53_003215 [Claviceps sorghi]